MAKRLRRITLSVGALLAGGALLALPGAGAVADPGGIRGAVLDATCYGPCSIDETPEPYSGEGLRLVIRKPADEDFLRRAIPEQGRFRVRLGPGVYRVTARIPDPCWQGETKQVRVRRGDFRRLELVVYNGCIL